MAIAFKELAAVTSGTGTSASVARPTGVAVGDFLVVVVGFEGVAAGSGPWVDASGSGGNDIAPNHGWKRVCYQDPSATGCGLEVWAAEDATGQPPGTSTLRFLASQTYVLREVSYTGQLPGNVVNNSVVRASSTQPWTGHNPETPSIYAYERELLIAVAAEQMASPGYGTPTPPGWTKRSDDKRTSFGNVEITIADKLVSIEGESAAVPWSADAASGASKGTTGIFAVRPVAAVLAATSPLIHLEYAVPT